MWFIKIQSVKFPFSHIFPAQSQIRKKCLGNNVVALNKIWKISYSFTAWARNMFKLLSFLCVLFVNKSRVKFFWSSSWIIAQIHHIFLSLAFHCWKYLSGSLRIKIFSVSPHLLCFFCSRKVQEVGWAVYFMVELLGIRQYQLIPHAGVMPHT